MYRVNSELKSPNCFSSKGLSSEGDGNRTRNHRIDSQPRMGCKPQIHKTLRQRLCRFAPGFAPANRKTITPARPTPDTRTKAKGPGHPSGLGDPLAKLAAALLTLSRPTGTARRNARRAPRRRPKGDCMMATRASRLPRNGVHVPLACHRSTIDRQDDQNTISRRGSNENIVLGVVCRASRPRWTASAGRSNDESLWGPPSAAN